AARDRRPARLSRTPGDLDVRRWRARDAARRAPHRRAPPLAGEDRRLQQLVARDGQAGDARLRASGLRDRSRERELRGDRQGRGYPRHPDRAAEGHPGGAPGRTEPTGSRPRGPRHRPQRALDPTAHHRNTGGRLCAGGDENRADRRCRQDARDGAIELAQHSWRGIAALRPEKTMTGQGDLPRGMDLLNRQALNKGTAFTDAERTDLGLLGLLPPHVETFDEQSLRAYEAYQRKTDDLERHIYLRALQDTNEVLFYRLLLDHVEEMTPIVYTPVVALACQQFSHIYRRPRGLFISYPLRDSVATLLRNRPNPEVDVIVVTDGERILGIGDQGAGGLGIPIGKLSLYTLIGGIRPERTLPIVLDVGTNNVERLKDPEYLGWRHERVTGQAYFDFIDQFVQAVKQELPNTCLQWEDFATPHARPILERYRDQLLTLNDDVQGTAAVALGAVLG